MKKKELNQFRTKGKAEVDKELVRLEKSLKEARLNIASGKESNLKEVKNIRKDIAQLLTIRGTIKDSEKPETKETKEAKKN